MAKKVVIISLGLFRASGGPVKTLSKFREALNADLYCFADANRVSRDPLANPHAHLVATSRLPILRQYCWVPPSNRLQVENAVRQASILSCHSFYRHHIEFTHSMFCKYGTPYWHVPHGILDPYVLKSGSLFKKSFLTLVGRRFLSNAACCIFASDREKEKAESVFGDLRGEVVHWPVDIPQTVLDADERRQLRKKWNVPEAGKALLYFGRLHPMKRPLETIRAVAAVKDPSLHLVIMGPEEGVTSADCRSEANRLGFKNLTVLDPIFGEEKNKVLQACDCYISLSHRENFNHCAAECLAAGLPVILSQGNDLGSEVVSSNSGWYLSGDDSNSWVQAIHELANMDLSRLVSMGHSGRSLVLEKFSFTSFQERLKWLLCKYASK